MIEDGDGLGTDGSRGLREAEDFVETNGALEVVHANADVREAADRDGGHRPSILRAPPDRMRGMSETVPSQRRPSVLPPDLPVRRTALLVAYAFPPVGGAGVQRMSKLAKYLPQHGIVPSVLTVANPSVPLTDESLARDLPASLDVIRARSLEPGYAAKKVAWEAAADAKPSRRKQAVRWATGLVRQLAYPDIQILWMPGAHAALAARMLRHPPDVVLISGPPFSQFLLAPLAKTRAAVVLDYRDEWSLIRGAYEMTRSTVARVVGDPLEAALLRI